MKKVTDKLWIAPQPSKDDLAEAARQGISAIINNRPDDEEPAQPSAAENRQTAEELGMDYIHIPIMPGQFQEGEVRDFQKALAEAGGRVLAHCKTGTRSLTLWSIGEVLDGRMTAEELVPFGQRLGVDLTGAIKWLESNSGPLRSAETDLIAARKPQVKGFFDKRTFSIQYVVADPETRKCAIIDPVLDFDERSGATATKNADAILNFVREQGFEVERILDTHPHADHLSAARYLKEKTGAPTAIGSRVTEVQELWKGIYNWPDFPADGSQWDRLFAQGDTFTVGSIPAKVLFSPGHTLASITYVIGDAAFVHDTLFMPDSGTARADFPGGNAKRLWRSIQEILSLPDETRVFTGHDYQPDDREPLWESTVGEQKAKNTHIAKCKSEAEFVKIREARDRTLPMPKLILHALQVNTNGGRLPEPEPNGRRYLKFPLNAIEGAAWD
ncbi:bifunctional sulfur transferase/dioxygenase Blh [Mesorhizobium muleiense]|uniref:bifunctional sulfur transferase/dioxygenase Blh n=1 Tax=Mesorhizobium muleiense TaxID=1004279 RepID=UPI003AFA95C4